MFNDPKFWLAISFTIFAVFIIKYVLPIILKKIDSKANAVAEEIKQAREIKQEAEKLLKDAEQYHKNIIVQSNKLIKEAKEEVDNILKNSQKEVSEELDRKMNLAMARIELEEQNAVKELKARIVSSAVNMVKNNISKIDNKNSSEIVANNAIEDIKKAL